MANRDDLDIEELRDPVPKYSPLDIEALPNPAPLDIEQIAPASDEDQPIEAEPVSPPMPKEQISSPSDQQQPQGQLSPLAMLLKAQENANQQRLVANLGKSASQVGGALGAALGGGMTHATMPDTSVYDELAKNSGAPVEQLQQQQAFSKATMQLQQDQQLADPHSDISKQYREILKKAFPKMNIPENTSASNIQRSGLVNIARVMASREAQQQDKAEARDLKKESENDKRFGRLSEKLMSETASSRSAFGRAANTIRSAEAIEQLAQGIDPNNLDNRQITEIARNLDSMLSSGQATVAGMKKLIPETALGSAAKMAEYIANQPKGAQQGAFVKRMLDTVQREKDLAKDQVKRTQGKVLAGYTDLKKKNPNRWEELMEAHSLGESSKEDRDPKIEAWAKQYGKSYDEADKIIRSRGYKSGQ